MKRWFALLLLLVILVLGCVIVLRLTQAPSGEASSEADSVAVTTENSAAPTSPLLNSVEEEVPYTASDTSPIITSNDIELPVFAIDSDDDSPPAQEQPSVVPSQPVVTDIPDAVSTPAPPSEGIPGISENEGEILDL